MQLRDKVNRAVKDEASVVRAAPEQMTIRNIAPALAIASCSALGLVANPVAAKGEPGTWDFDTAALYYAESDDRVMAVEPVFSATRNFEEGQYLNLKGVFDALTGASPNGATPSDSIQTFTRPSGSGQYDVAAGESPLDDTFKDTRVALSATWNAPLNREWDYSAGVYGSKEYDYLSLGLSGGLTRYLNNKNTTLNFGLSYSSDQLDPVGNVPKGLAAMPHKSSPTYDADRAASRVDSSDSKGILDVLFGVTQVINRQTIMQFNYAMSLSDGYLNDPYKLLSVIDDDALGGNYGGNVVDGNGNNIYLYGARPDSRMKHSLFWQTKYARENGDVIDGSYRFMTDDWGITSHTFETSYRWNLGDSYLEPHFRYYMQSDAGFYKRYITASEYNGGSVSFNEASSDYRLGDLDSMTVGLKYGWKFDKDSGMNVRLEYFVQTSSGDSGIGALASQELYPDTDAVMLKFGYSF